MILWDTGPLYAAFDRRDKHHEASAALMRRTASPLLVPAPVVIETCYHLTKHLGARAEIALLKAFQSGDLAMVTPTKSDFDRAVELVERCAGFPSASPTPTSPRSRWFASPSAATPGQTRVHCPVRPLQHTPRAVRKASGNREERLRVDVIDREHDPRTARDLVRRH